MKELGRYWPIFDVGVPNRCPSVGMWDSPPAAISQYVLIRFDVFLVLMISTMNSRYPISFLKIVSF